MFGRIHAALETSGGIENLEFHHQAQNPGHFPVNQRFRQFAFADGINQGLCKIILVVRLIRTHFQIQTSSGRSQSGMSAVPVTDKNPVKTQLLAHKTVQQIRIFGTPKSPKLIIGCHNGISASLLHSGFKGRQVNFMQCPVAHFYIHCSPVGFLIVGNIMLDTGCHIATLQALNIGCCHLCHQIGVFAHVFEVSATERRTDNIDTGAQQNILAPETGLFAQNFSAQTGQIYIPACCQGCSGGKISGGIVGPTRVIPIIPIDFCPYTVRAVREGQLGNTQSGYSLNVKFGISV